MFTMNDFVKEDNPVLRKVAEEVILPPSQEDKQILNDLMDYVRNSQNSEIATQYGLRAGIGLAAPQVNISKRMIAVHLKNEKGDLVSHALFNPKLVSHSLEMSYLTAGEGCLSVNRTVSGYVPRYARIKVSGTNLEGEVVKLRLKGIAAICFQHEIDHLNGIMFYDHINAEDPFDIPEDYIPIER
ncbi:peptide deformylase [Peribacillus sp. NPDC097295]|uniref:peptide deformylase n=1 Tax=Peribacillus sp. NPDC097295 TaxID=3364402 RepID=UPI0037F4D996